MSNVQQIIKKVQYNRKRFYLVKSIQILIEQYLKRKGQLYPKRKLL